jgi:hypothetical protein|tara:strand:- start:759 stop:1004 length:246 start_codon:yes stop_codon:yes gene_type:complete
MTEDTKVVPATNVDAPELSIQDIVLAANIIDLGMQRGAFKAAEAAQVGKCFEKMVTFIKANTPDTATTTEAPAEEAEAPKE